MTCYAVYTAATSSLLPVIGISLTSFSAGIWLMLAIGAKRRSKAAPPGDEG